MGECGGRAGGGYAECADKVAHLVRGGGVDGRKVAKVIVEAFCRERWGSVGPLKAVLYLLLLVESVEDVDELVFLYAKGFPAGLPYAFVLCEICESAGGTGIGGDVWDSEIGEDMDMKIDGEAADELKWSVAFCA